MNECSKDFELKISKLSMAVKKKTRNSLVLSVTFHS